MVDGAAGQLGQAVGVIVQDPEREHVQIQAHLMEDLLVLDLIVSTPPALEMTVPKWLASGLVGLPTLPVALAVSCPR